MSGHKLDEIDLRILEILQTHGQSSRSEMAEEVKLSIPSVSERIRKLSDAGFIRSINAVIEAEKVHLDITAFIVLTSESPKHYPKIIERTAAFDEILECHAITGEGSHILKIRTHNTSTFEKLLAEIQSWPGVRTTRSNLILSTHKETTALPLQYLLDSEVITS
ncbi:MAG: Lrp/AsnC family transcriptional regulator [Acidobacteriota bacterium]|nr:Lrp/AsnC family transcriptional regulator [Acidobacteriota bacterium]